MKRTSRLSLVFSLITIMLLLLTGCVNTQSGSNKSLFTPTPGVTLAPNTGIIKGALFVEMNGKYYPAKDIEIFLPKVLISPSGKTGVAGLDINNDPRIATDKNGNFIFYNVKPGKYALLLYFVTKGVILDDPNAKATTSLIIDVAANKTIDLGDLKYSELPITPTP